MTYFIIAVKIITVATNYQVKHCDEFNLSQQTHENILSIFYNEKT